MAAFGGPPPPDPKPGDPGIKWCSDCGRYYNPESPHECKDKEVISNRRTLERWLGRFKIREEEQ